MTKYFVVLVFVQSLIGTTRGVSLRTQNVLHGQFSEEVQPYIDNHSAAPAVNLNSLGVDSVTSGTWESFENDLLSSSESRFVGNPAIEKAARFIESEFLVMGLEVQSDQFDSPAVGDNHTARNIVARLVGSTDESILVGAHYDSLPTQGPSPGADDNASGVATLLSVAKALTGHRSVPLKRNIIFVAFSGEEQGMKGSEHFALQMAPTMHIVSSIILDQDGNPGSSSALIYESVGDSADKLRIIDTLAESTDNQIAYIGVNHKGFGSDHVSLTEKGGIPSVLVIERDNMALAAKYGHSSRDTIENINPEYGSAIARTVLNAVVRLAMA